MLNLKIKKSLFSRIFKKILGTGTSEENLVFLAKRAQNLENIITKIQFQKPDELRVSNIEANINQTQFNLKKAKIFHTKKKENIVLKLKSLVGCEGELAHINLLKILELAKNSRAIIGFYGKYKFYLTEEITIKLMEKFSFYFKKEQKTGFIKTKCDQLKKRSESMSFISLNDPRVTDLLMYIDLNLSNFSTKNKLKLLLILHKISPKEYSDLIRQKMVDFSSPNDLQLLNLNELANLLRLSAFLKVKNSQLIKIINDVFMNRFLEIYELGKISVVQELEDPTHETETNFISCRHFCLLIWAFNVLSYRGTLMPILASEILNNDLHLKLQYSDLCHFVSGLSILPKIYRDPIYEKVNQQIQKEDFQILENENEDTLRNLLISLLNEPSCRNSCEVLTKSLIFRTKQISSKSFSFLFSSLSKQKFKLFKDEVSQLSHLFDFQLTKMSVKDTVQILFALFRIIKNSNNENVEIKIDVNRYIKKCIERVQLLVRGLTKNEILVFEKILAEDDIRFRKLKDFL